MTSSCLQSSCCRTRRFGRRVYGIGNGIRVARLSGSSVGRAIIGVCMLFSALSAALVGIPLTGLSGEGSLDMDDNYLLPSIAVVVGSH
jgi:ribose transport system permease protein